MPIHFLDSKGPYQLPTGWHEVSTRQYCELDARKFETMEQRASYFAGRSIEVNGYVARALFWMLKPPTTEFGMPYPTDLGQETYLQVETIRALLAAGQLYQSFGMVYGLFVAREQHMRGRQYAQFFDQTVAASLATGAMEKPVTDTFPAVAHCLAELARLNTKYAALWEPDNTEAGRKARQAGSDRLAIFSHMNVARHYAEKFGVGIGDIYQTNWETVAIWLLQDRINAEILDNLQQQSNNDSK